VVGDGTTFTDPGDVVSIDINNTIWIGIHDSFGEMYEARILSYRYFESGEWTGNSAVYSPPAISTAPGWTYLTDGYLERWLIDLRDPDSTEIPLPGVGCAIEFRALSMGYDPVIYLNMSPGGAEDELLLHIVPEPTTVLLLALGSVVLTRRRR
ncbi:MAG: PEP-CTERM sorting domain-containing protein, partial [Sedimentisphaerales bacterium]|nr:PEP-CTERM sorting domain-containing protein [Sedimentisphaerales bacterium]